MVCWWRETLDDCVSREPGIWDLKDKMDDMGNPSGHCMAWGIYFMCEVSNIKYYTICREKIHKREYYMLIQKKLTVVLEILTITVKKDILQRKAHFGQRGEANGAGISIIKNYYSNFSNDNILCDVYQ